MRIKPDVVTFAAEKKSGRDVLDGLHVYMNEPEGHPGTAEQHYVCCERHNTWHAGR